MVSCREVVRRVVLEPVDEIREDLARTNRRQLVWIADEDQTLDGVPVDAADQGCEEREVEHRGLINDVGRDCFFPASTVWFESKVVIQPSAAGEEGVNGASIATGAFSHAIGGLAGGGEKLHSNASSVRFLDSIQEGLDDRGLPGPGLTREHRDWLSEDCLTRFDLLVESDCVVIGVLARIELSGSVKRVRHVPSVTGKRRSMSGRERGCAESVRSFSRLQMPVVDRGTGCPQSCGKPRQAPGPPFRLRDA